ncbi:MAG TPA: condensation domain-containing protein [Actinophytocola sp.]|uniref:condensation domain-containing protein n=1 Tax=Actinophytocola sp. TaxID=1872138 RepID=UPI002E03AFA3|nr:condensation domain-containing protein [Actinophytocola sp.]
MGGANLRQVWPLPDGVTVADVRGALEALEERHEGMRTRYQLDPGHDLAQLVWAPEPVGFDVREGGADATALAGQVSAELGDEPFALAVDKPWRARLITSAGQPAFLAVSVHHITADGWSMLQLGTEFLDLLAGKDLGEPAPTCRELAEEQHSDAWADRRTAAVEYWRRVVAEVPDPPAQLSADARTRWATLRSAALSRHAQLLAGQVGVPLPSVVFAAYAAAMRTRTGPDAHLVAVFAGNRLEPRWRNLVTSMNQIVPVVARCVDGEDLPAGARRQHWELVRSLRHGIFDVDAVTDAVREYGKNGSGPGFRYFYNFRDMAQAAILPVTAGDSAESDWTVETSLSERNNQNPFYLRAHAGEELMLSLQETSPAGDFEPMRRFVITMAEQLRDAATAGGAG